MLSSGCFFIWLQLNRYLKICENVFFFSTATSITGAGVGALKKSTVAYKRTISDIFFLTLWTYCRVRYLYHAVFRRHKALAATTLGDFKILTRSNKSLSVTLLSARFGVQRFHGRRHSGKQLSLCSPRASLLGEKRAWQRRTVQFAAESAVDRCASTACYRAKVTRSLDACHWLSEDVCVCVCARTQEGTGSNF